MNIVKKGSADVTRYVMLKDSTAGTPKTGYTIADLDLQYTRNRSSPAAKVDATALAATNSSHADNKAIEVDGASSPGLYRIDWPDAAFASGADKVVLVVSGSGIDPAVEEIQLVNCDIEDGVRLGLTALPNAAADAAGGLPISDAGGLDLDALRADVAAILVDTGTTLQGELDGIQADTEDIQSRLPAALTGDGLMKADTLRVGGTLQTAGDVPALIVTATSYIDTEVATIISRLGTPSDLGSGATVAANLVDIEAQTDDIGVAGAGLTAADDAILTAIAALNNLSQENIRTAVGLASANLDTQLDALPTNAELATALGTADDAVLAQIALVKAKTDSLTFTVPNVVDSNIQRVNDVAVTGTGADGDEWGPG